MGQKTFTFLESTNPICLFTIQILWDHDDYKGSFTLEPSNIKTVFRREYSKSREMGSQMAVFGLVSPTYDRETDRQTSTHSVVRQKCTCDQCACAESRDPWVGGEIQVRFWNLRRQFAYSPYKFYGAMTTIKGRLLWSRRMLKLFSGKKILSPVEMRPQNGGFWRKLWSKC